jgi:2-iminobutanoate/2-iminopropanoate deaminase
MRQPPSPAQIHRYAHLRNYCRKPRLRALALLYISGDVGVRPDGTVPDTIEAQAEACWQNIIAILGDAGMGVQDLVKITTYPVRPEDVAAAGAARAKHFGDARPGSATIIVKTLVNPSLLIEIEAVAAARAR